MSAEVIGDVEGEHSSVWMNAVVRGDVNAIRIGSNLNVQDCAVLHGTRYVYPVIVGDWVTIGHNATVHGCVVEDARLIGMKRDDSEQRADRRGVYYCGGGADPGEHGDPAELAVAGLSGKVRRTLADEDRKR